MFLIQKEVLKLVLTMFWMILSRRKDIEGIDN